MPESMYDNIPPVWTGITMEEAEALADAAAEAGFQFGVDGRIGYDEFVGGLMEGGILPPEK